jgi:hypothetical protein
VATEVAGRGIAWRAEQAVLWGSFPVAVVCLMWMVSGSPVAAATFVVVFGLSMTVQVRRAMRREGVEREIMLRAAAISSPILTTVLVATLAAVTLGVIDASAALPIPLIAAVTVHIAVENVLTWRLG